MIEFQAKENGDIDGVFNGGRVTIFTSEVDGSWLGMVHWTCRGVEIIVSTNSEPLQKWTLESTMRWAQEVVESGPELAIDLLFRTVGK